MGRKKASFVPYGRVSASIVIGGLVLGTTPAEGPSPRPSAWYHRAPLWETDAGVAPSLPVLDVVLQPPLGLTDVGDNSVPAFADIDADGDYDLFVGEIMGSTFFFENVGTPTAPAFAPPVVNPFGLEDVGFNGAPTFADLDGDGDLDAFIGDRFGQTSYFRNTGTAAAPAFRTAGVNPFGLTDVGYHNVPNFADLDGDGDLDGVFGERFGRTKYFENTGTVTDPVFAQVVINPFGLTDVGSHNIDAFADLDGDGDLDGFLGERFGTTLYYENTGTAAAPAFAPPVPNAFGFADVGFLSAPVFADLDGDGDLDAVTGSKDGLAHFHENVGTFDTPAFELRDNLYGLTDVGDNSRPVFADLDGDGDADAFVGERYGNTYYFENTGSSAAPAFASPAVNPYGLKDVGFNAVPAFADLDGDGDLDAFFGEHFGRTFLARNVGTDTNPVFQASGASPFGLTDVGYDSAPVFADLDGDGDLDAFIGEASGTTQYFENTGTPTSPAFAPPVTGPWGLTDVGDGSIPAFADLDGDGDLDAFIGEASGTTQYFENTGTPTSPAFAPPVTNPFGLMTVAPAAAPAFADLDGDGDLDVFLGDAYGVTHSFENVTLPAVTFEASQGGDALLRHEAVMTLPATVRLAQNYPNPFNPSTEIAYELPAEASVRLEVFDVQGRAVATLFDGRQAAGRHTVRWEAGALPSGLYVYRLVAGGTVGSRVMMLVK